MIMMSHAGGTLVPIFDLMHYFVLSFAINLPEIYNKK